MLIRKDGLRRVLGKLAHAVVPTQVSCSGFGCNKLRLGSFSGSASSLKYMLDVITRSALGLRCAWHVEGSEVRRGDGRYLADYKQTVMNDSG